MWKTAQGSQLLTWKGKIGKSPLKKAMEEVAKEERECIKDEEIGPELFDRRDTIYSSPDGRNILPLV